MKTRFLALVLLSSSLLVSHQATAIPPHLASFEAEYPSSTANDAQCQLCHVNPGGGAPWNAYGWGIRERRLGGMSISQALTNISVDNSDGSPDGVTTNNIAEINAGTQPGWTVGNNNTYFYAFQANLNNQPPPISLPAGVLVDIGAAAAPGGPENDPIPGGILRGDITVAFETLATGLSSPILVKSRANQNVLFIGEQGGHIRRLDLQTNTVSSYVNFAPLLPNFVSGGERGLLGFAFHPDFETNGLFYTHTSESVNGAADFSTIPMGQPINHQAVIREWQLTELGNMTQADNPRVILKIDQPQGNHNGGSIEFGPDGNLFIAIGDGGGSNDEGVGHPAIGNGQDFDNPLGAILRIDVDGNDSDNGQYGIPRGITGNPFVDVGEVVTPGLDEIYAYGFRNPYRFSINDLGGGEFDLYVGDVGQRDIEEIDHVSSTAPGGNYGWRLKEGSFFFYNDAGVCQGNAPCVSADPPQGVALPNMIDPIVEYDHDEGLSVIGGQVYTGSAISELSDRYVFAEFAQGFSPTGGRLFYINEAQEMREFRYQGAPNMRITAVGSDDQGELYLVGTQPQGGGSTGVLKRVVLAELDDDLCLPINTGNDQVAIICL